MGRTTKLFELDPSHRGRLGKRTLSLVQLMTVGSMFVQSVSWETVGASAAKATRTVMRYR